MTTQSGFVFLVLACTTANLFAIASAVKDNNLTVVHVMNSLPKSSPYPLKIQCKSKNMQVRHGEEVLKVGDDYRWTVEKNEIYYCQAVWFRFFASWHAFQPQRDLSNETVYWLIKDNGFFHSWDNSSWVRKETWQTE
ncbi:hypothetical protein I3843_01G197200 [Carya illinoinensis]|uniref:S-protein homolog n=1 Tax=Carya illinoinensis TaxID=32201 RepID=A0A8T1RRP9_CARIL|nr:hypothetical protein CIPAW_01G204700 [Carya illinoinensis]KAG6732994.1 hypothetical protein I3842_01G204600 [Carya illinoinensis]KAG7997143.1 hypothetical protein I3843_01G197200 [Carya illinoinensis]